MNDSPFFSIIVPVYNTERYLEECINSVITQTYDSWELILVDDGSYDSSPLICDEYSGKYNNIITVHKKNTGQFEARAEGIKRANGKYCIGLDSDDYYDINCLEVLHEVIEKNDVDMVSFNLRHFGIDNRDIMSNIEYEKIYNNEEFINYVVKEGDHSFCTKVVKTEILRLINFDEHRKIIKYNEDYLLIILALCHIKKVYVIHNILYNYRKVGDSISTVYNADTIFNSIEVGRCVQSILDKNGYLTSDIVKYDYIAFLKALSTRLRYSVEQRSISISDYDKMHEQDYYSKSKEFERREYFSYDRYIVLSLFRKKNYWLLGVYVLYKRIKKKCGKIKLKFQF